jgi:hypothetical protein
LGTSLSLNPVLYRVARDVIAPDSSGHRSASQFSKRRESSENHDIFIIKNGKIWARLEWEEREKEGPGKISQNSKERIAIHSISRMPTADSYHVEDSCSVVSLFYRAIQGLLGHLLPKDNTSGYLATFTPWNQEQSRI